MCCLVSGALLARFVDLVFSLTQVPIALKAVPREILGIAIECVEIVNVPALTLALSKLASSFFTPTFELRVCLRPISCL